MMAKLLPAGKSITATHLWQDIEMQMISFNILCLSTANHMKGTFLLYIGAPLGCRRAVIECFAAARGIG